MEIRNLIGMEFMDGENMLKIVEVKKEEENIILVTETLKNKEIKTEIKKYSFSEQSLNMFKNVHPNLVKIMKVAIENSPFDFRITAGARTAEEQNALYQIGRTRAGNKVTNADGYRNKSNHQIKADGYGYAVDIFICGKYDEQGNYIKFNTTEGYDFKKLKAVADHIKSIAKTKGYKVEWGGDWKAGWDSPHFELKS